MIAPLMVIMVLMASSEADKARARKWYQDNKKRAAIANKARYEVKRDTYLAARKAYRDVNKAAGADRARRYREAHKEETAAQKRAWQDANKERLSEKYKQWCEANREHKAAYDKAWVKNNPDKFKASQHKRRTRVKGADGFFTKEDIQRLLVVQESLCAGCRKNIATTYTVDHVNPIALRGTNWPDNIQLLCRHCNSSKRHMHPDAWAAKIGKLFV